MSIYPQNINLWPKVTVYGCDFRSNLLDMADTITRLELWEWLKNYTPDEGSGFMYSRHTNITKISNGLENNDHSGATFAYCLRCMESIAKNGFDGFKSKFQT